MKRRINLYASFKDPAARVFYFEDEEDFIYRELSPSYLPNYYHLKSSGLSVELINKKWLIPFEEIIDSNGTITLQTRKIQFVSFPYEWTFNQWKDAALLTLKIQYQALKHGMTLKDATPFNVVFDGCRPLFIDISSFEIFKEGQPWKAFKQFSENFYMPILLIKYFDAIGNEIYLNNTNGIPLKKGLSLLPARAYLNFNTIFYLAFPAMIRNKLKVKQSKKSSGYFTLTRSLQFAEKLFLNIKNQIQPKIHTQWNNYYNTNINANYLVEKEQLINTWIGTDYKNKKLIDFGCNTGHFSKLLAQDVQSIIAFDEDIRSVNELYLHCRKEKINNVFCFTANASQPSPPLGWNNMERPALKERLKADIGLALAFVHHLAISNQIQFNMMTDFFASTCNEMIIEFVPKEDEKVQLLLSDREDIFEWYNWFNFRDTFKTRFTLIKEHHFSNNRIVVHFMLKKNEQ